MKIIALLVVFAIPALSLQERTAISKGMCSPAVTGDKNTITITCTALSERQQRLIENLPSLLEKLLAAKTENTTEIISKLNTCIEQTAPRTITEEQKLRLIAGLKHLPGKPSLRIRATNSTPESSRYANQLRDTFASIPGWEAPPVFENMVVGSAPVVGLVAYVNSDQNMYGIALQRLFRELAIPIQFWLDPTMPAEVIVLVVGQKPLN